MRQRLEFEKMLETNMAFEHVKAINQKNLFSLPKDACVAIAVGRMYKEYPRSDGIQRWSTFRNSLMQDKSSSVSKEGRARRLQDLRKRAMFMSLCKYTYFALN